MQDTSSNTSKEQIMAKKKYTVKNTNLLHNGKTYKIGEVIELDEDKGKKLEDILTSIEEETDTSTKIATKTPTAAKTKTTAKAKADTETTAETTDETVSNGTATTDASATDGGDK